MNKGDRETRGEGEPATPAWEPTDLEAGHVGGSLPDSETASPCSLGLRNARRGSRRAGLVDLGVSDLGATIAMFAEVVAVMRRTGNQVDAALLHALICRLAELLGETMPPDV